MSTSRTYYKYKDGTTGVGGGGVTPSPPSASADLQDAYIEREPITTPLSFLELGRNGMHRIDADSWAGFVYPPANCIPHGNLDIIVNGTDEILTYTDDDGFSAELRKVNGEWQIEDEENSGGWLYHTSAQLPEFDEEGNQLGLSATIKNGKMFDFSQFIIRKGDRFMGLLPAYNVLSGVPKLEEGQHIASINGSYVYYIDDWEEITDGPANLTGKGFLRISYYNGIVHFQAYSFENGETTMAHATIPAQGEEMTKWRIDTDVFATIEQLNNRLELYALKNHIHDDRYYIKAEIEAIVAQYKLAEWLPEIADVKGLAITLLNKIDVSLFQNALPGDAIVLGPEGVPVAADLTDAYTTTVALVNAKEGVAYSTVIEDISLVYPRGAENKRISAVASGRWMGFAGAIVGGSGAHLTLSGTPTSAGVVMISLDFIWTIAGMERREQRILFLTVEPAAASITAPNAPTGLTATAVSTSQINLVWVDNATNESVQEIERSTNAGFTDAAKIATVEANVTSYQDKVGLSPGVTYHYRVRAANSTANSAWDTDSATTLTDVLPTSGLWANYYDTTNINALGTADEGRVDTVINFDLTADAPSEDVTPGAYIARWSGFIKTPVSGNFQFNFDANAKFRIYFGGVLVVDSWVLTTLRSAGFSRAMTADVQVPILIEYLQTNADTFARLGYTNGNVNDVVPTAWLVPLDVAPLVAPVLSAANVDSDTIRLSWTLTTDPDSYEVFGGVVDNANNNSILPLLTNVNPVASARTIDVNGLPAGVTFVFEMRSKKNGVYSELSNRATASTPNATDVPNSAAPVILIRPALSVNTLITQFTDNNTGDTELYTFRFKQVGTGTWYYRTISGGLSTNEADAYASTYPAGSTRELNFSNDFFAGKLIRVEVRVTKDGLFSPWAGSEETEDVAENRAYEIIEMDKFRPRKATNGLWYDSTAETDNSVFHNFYYSEDSPALLYNADGTPRPFRDISIPSNSCIMFRKLRMRKSVFPTINSFNLNGWLANLENRQDNNGHIQYNDQAIIRTFDEAYIPPTTPPVTPPVVTPPVTPPTTQTRAQAINYNEALSHHIIIYIMSWASWRIDHIKALALTSKNAGLKAIHIPFSPFKVWNNYTSAGAFNADSLTWDWTNINTIINYVCNDLGLKLIVRLHPDMSDFSLTTLAANADTPDLTAAWGGHFDKNSSGGIIGLKIDNFDTPPWMLFRRFCAAFKAQYNTYWTTGKIALWEFAINTNQEAQIFPDSTISYPNYVDYVNRTEQMYAMGQLMLSIMSGWDDSQWNVGSWINEGYQLKGNTMGYNRYTQGFRGMRGNHDSNWSGELRDFHDMVMYTRKQKAANRFFSVEYFRTGNVSSASAMAAAMARSINNGAWQVGFVFEGDTQTVQGFITEVAGALQNSGHLSRALASPTVHPVENEFTLFAAWNQAYPNGHDLMVQAFNNYRNQNNGTRQYIGVSYEMGNTPSISVSRIGSNQIRVTVLAPTYNAADGYEYSFREVGTSTWYTWDENGVITTNDSNPGIWALLSGGGGISNITSSYFVGKTVQARVRMWKSGQFPSTWSNIVSE